MVPVPEPLTAAQRDVYVRAFESRFTHPDALAAVQRIAFQQVFRETRAQLVVLRTTKVSGSAEALGTALRRADDLLAFWGVDKRVTFVLLPCDIPRTWPAPGEAFAPAHINGGFTVRDEGAASVTVYLFRREEAAKVMLHEALHHTRVHVDVPATVTAGLRDAFRIHADTPLLVNEGIVEAAATLYNALFAGQGDPALVAKERAHAFALARRLQNGQRGPWREGTNAYAYIVVRALCFASLESFLEILRRLRRGMSVADAEWLAFFQSALTEWERIKPSVTAYRGRSLRLTRYGEYLRIR